MTQLFLVTFDANSEAQDHHHLNWMLSNEPIPRALYTAVDKSLKNQGVFFKPMHQIRLLLTKVPAKTVRDNVARVTGKKIPIAVISVPKNSWAISHPDPVIRLKLARWLRHDFTAIELAQAAS